MVAPLTANTLAKLAYGIADNVLTEAVLAHRGPILVAPAMNPRMWSHAATRRTSGRSSPAASSSSGRTRARWPRASGESGGWPSRRRSRRRRAAARPGAARRPACSRDRRRDARAGRLRALCRQPLLGPDGRRPGRGGLPARRGGDAARGEPRGPAPTRVADDRDADGGGDAGRGARGSRMSISRCSRLRSPITGPAEALDEAREERRGVDARARADRRHRAGARRAQAARPGPGRIRRRARGGRPRRKRRMLDDKHADLVVYNDVSRDDIGFDAPDNEVVLVTAHGERRVPKAGKREIAAASSMKSRACLDEISRIQSASPRRPRLRRRSWTTSHGSSTRRTRRSASASSA